MRAPTAPLAAAWARVRANPGLWLVLAVVQVVLLEVAARPLSAALAPLLDHTPAAERMLLGDDGLMLDLIVRQRLLSAAIGGLAPLVLTAAVLWGWLQCGAIFVALEREGGARPPVSEMLAALARHAPRMMVIGLAGLVLRVAVIALVVVGALLLRPDRAGTFSAVAARVGALALVGGFLWSLATTLLDCARSLAVRGERPWRALRGALGVARRRLGGSLRLATLSALLFVALTVATQLVLAACEELTLLHLVALWLTASARVALTALTLLAAAFLASDG